MKTVLTVSCATTLREMIDALEEMAFIQGLDTDPTYVTINSDSVRLQLIEETLSDGSKVYNVELAEASNS